MEVQAFNPRTQRDRWRQISEHSRPASFTESFQNSQDQLENLSQTKTKLNQTKPKTNKQKKSTTTTKKTENGSAVVLPKDSGSIPSSHSSSELSVTPV